MSLAHRQIFGAEPLDYYYYDPYEGDYDASQQERESWQKLNTLFQVAGYPLGTYLSRRYYGSRQYSFGDAMMLIGGRGAGLLYGFLISDLLGLFDDGGDMGWRWVTTLTSVGGVVGMDRYIRGVDYSFGQSALMLLGGIAGGAFGVGLGVLIEADETSFFDFAIIAGSLGGLALTRRIISPLREGVYRSGRGREPAVSLALQPVAMSGGMLPGVGLEIRW